VASKLALLSAAAILFLGLWLYLTYRMAIHHWPTALAVNFVWFDIVWHRRRRE
jgi:hypothetical protein